MQNQVQGADEGSGSVQHTVEKESETGECKLEVPVLSCKPEIWVWKTKIKISLEWSCEKCVMEKSCWKLYLFHFCSLFSINTPSIDSHVWWCSSEPVMSGGGGVSSECSVCALLMSSNWAQHLDPRRPRSFHRGWGNTNKLGHTLFFGSWAGWRERLAALEV